MRLNHTLANVALPVKADANVATPSAVGGRRSRYMIEFISYINAQ